MPAASAYIVRQTRRIPPFDECAREALIRHRPLAEWQDEALRAAGFTPRRVDRADQIDPYDTPALTLTDDLYFSRHTIAAFVRLAREADGNTRLVIRKETTFARVLAPFQAGETNDWITFPLVYRRNSGEAPPRDLPLAQEETPIPVAIPGHMRGEHGICLPATLQPILQITHPAHILSANIAALLAPLMEVKRSAWRRLKLFVRARSRKPHRLLRGLNRIGRRCDIHPSAVIEGSEIGDRVHIGANAVVRLSSIGDDCDIGDCAVVKSSVVGHGSVLFNDLNLGFAVCYPETFLVHGPYHLSVFGRQAAMFATILTDFRLDGKPILLDVDGELKPYGAPFAGSFIGHRTRVGGGSIIAPGRIIPSDLLIFPPIDSVLTYLDGDLPKRVPLSIHNGRLREVLKK